MILSAPPEAIRAGLSSHVTALMVEALRALARVLPAGTSQTRRVLSAAAEASRVLSPENFRERIAPWWPVRFFASLPVATLQILMRPSSPPVASHFPSELAA